MARVPGDRTVASALSEIDRRVDAAHLSDEDRAAIKAKAREHVAKKRKDKAEAELLAKEIREEEIAYNPAEQIEDVQINIPPFVAAEKLHGACISLDGRLFFHGLVYPVPYGVARVLEDVMARSWEHEREIHGDRRKADVNRRPNLPTLRQGAENMPPSQLNTRSSILRSDTSI